MSAIQYYTYRGRDTGGKVVKGKLEASTEGAAVARLRTMSITPIDVRPAAAGTGLQMEISVGFLEKKVKLKDLAVMSRQMSTMVGAGLSILKTLTILGEQTDNTKLRESLNQVRTQIEGGSSLSDSFARQPTIYPPLMIHLVRAGEVGGFLDMALHSVAETFEKDVKLRATIKSAMTYPVVVLAMALLGVIGMLLFIVPVFEQMFTNLGSSLPIPTQILVTLSDNMVWALPLLVVAIVIFSVWWGRNKHEPKVRRVVDTWKLKLPVFGSLFQKIAIARFARNFATMTKSGVPILQSLAIVGETSGNYVVEEAMHKVQDSVRVGRSVAAPLMEEPVFPAMVSQMVAVGEDSGALETMLAKIADFYDDEVDATTEQLTALIEPLLIGLLGVVIGGMVVALYLPMFSIFDQIK
jgi:type IV pilus assembly protein PilC